MAQEFYFAWVTSGGTAFGPEHHVQDEAVVGLEIEHQEKEVPGMRILVRNPKVGLLNPSRRQWAWVSWRKPDNNVVPLFHGRLVAMPTDLVMETVTLEFHARPEDYEEQKKALAETLKVAPYWDPVFIEEDRIDDPDAVLTARPDLWHVGRTDKTLTISNILSGEAGTVMLDGNTVLGRRCDIQYGTPLDHLQVKASVEWTQSAFGNVDMSAALAKEFGGLVASYTGEGLERTWPIAGTDIGGGWSVEASNPNLLNTSVDSSEKLVVPLNPMNDTPPPDVPYDEWLAERMLDPIREARFPRWDFRPKFVLRYQANRSRKEVLEFNVKADVQRFYTDETPTDEEVVEISAVSTVVDSVLPTRKVRSYFETDRGQQSIGFLLNLARSALLMAARAVQITVDIPWSIAIQLSCRHDVVLQLPELPGGQAGGKVIGYGISMDPDAGEMLGFVTFAAIVGMGNTLDPPGGGTSSWVETDYVADEYQVFLDESVQPVPGEIEYKRPTYKPADDDIDFDNMTPDNVLKDLQATALLTFAGPATDGSTVSIGGRTYTFRDLADNPNEVLVGLSAEACAQNLTDAIEALKEREGLTFGTGTVAHANVGATVEGGIMRATARVGGVQGNSIAVSDTVANANWDQPHLYDGSDGLVVQNPAQAQEAWMLSGDDPGSTTMAVDKLNQKFTLVQMGLKEVVGGPFETEIDLVVSDLMVPQTIDLAAAPL